MNYEQELLNRLIDKYEKSKAFLTGTFTRKIALTAAQEDWIQRRMENMEEKRLFFAVLKDLKESGLIDYSWERFEQGNLVDKIWLVPDEAAVRACYKRLGRRPAREEAEALAELIREYRRQLATENSLARFLADYEEELRAKGQIRQYFTHEPELNENILKCLIFMEQNQGEQMERLMSSSLYGDSKYFERHVKSKVLIILRALKRREQEEGISDSMPEDDELLLEKGVVRWPEILEFTGRLRVALDDGNVIDYGPQIRGAYINSETVKHAVSVEAEGIRKVLFIENKANYVWYISQNHSRDELVIYHGGCYSPMKGRWFRMVHEGCRRQTLTADFLAGKDFRAEDESQAAEHFPMVKYLHWGDIDVGGFRMFVRLKGQIVPELMPYRMDRASLEAYRGQAMEITSAAYLKTLERMEDSPEYEMFHEVISLMRRERIRLEQEQMIV